MAEGWGQPRVGATDRRETWQAGLKTRLLRGAHRQHKYQNHLRLVFQSDPFVAGLVLDADTLLSALTESRVRFCHLRTGRGRCQKD